jgi:hypothetical protein
VRVPAILVSAWVQKGSVIDEVFEHACIPGTLTELLLGAYDARSPREIAFNNFLNYLSLDVMRADDDIPDFALN